MRIPTSRRTALASSPAAELRARSKRPKPSEPVPRDDGTTRLRWSSPTQLGAAVTASAVAGLVLAASGDWKVAFGMCAGAAFVALGFVRPALFLALVLLVRPLLDDLSQATAGLPSANVAGALAVLIIGVFLVVIASVRLTRPGATTALLVLVVTSMLAALEGMLLHPEMGLEPVIEIARLIAMVAVYVLAANFFGTPSRARTLFALIGLSAVVPALFGVSELLSDPEVATNVELARISGTFVGPNPFGAFLAVAALVLIFMPPGILTMRVRLFALAPMLIALVATYSRVGLVVFAVGVVVLGWGIRKGIVVAFALALIAVLVALPTVRERMLPFGGISDQPTAQSEGYESYDWRLENWGDLLGVWEERPLLGHGLRSTVYVNPRSPAGGEGKEGGGYQAHHTIVRTLVEGGVVLLAAYVFFFVTMIVVVRRLTRDRGWELNHLARVVAVIWSLVILVALTTDDPTELTATMYAVFAMTGALEGAYRNRFETEREEEHSDPGEPDRRATHRPGKLTPAPTPG